MTVILAHESYYPGKLPAETSLIFKPLPQRSHLLSFTLKFVAKPLNSP
ncbi:hypothetical protein [Leptolyngbya sp. FACHB-671]|nr:hypothetical protein [Leptolyngbya sp. FACHB-671]